MRRIYRALQQQNTDELRRSLTHDVTWTLPETLPWGGTQHGHLGIATLADIFQEHVHGSWADPEEFLEAGDRVLILGRTSGRARSSGRTFQAAFAHVWGMTDGMPSSFRGYLDTAPIMAALEGARA